MIAITPEASLQEEALKIASLAAQVVHDSNEGKMHKFGAYKKVSSVILAPGAPPKHVLVGVMIPVEVAMLLIGPAGEILKAREEAGNGE